MFEVPKYVLEILDKLEDNGFQAFLVGGSVRDYLLGKVPVDFDITTNATPNEIKGCFKNVIETGIKHGTVTVVTKNGNVEITTYRIDGEYNNNRHPKNVTFTRSLDEDLKRRDFTVNAMAYNPKSGLVDLFFGQSDLQNKIIRSVGEADKRFSEDALRILRAIRFASVLDFKIDKATKESILKNKALLKNISGERILAEFKKLILGKNAKAVLKEYKEVILEFIYDIEFENIDRLPCEFKLRAAYVIKGDLTLPFDKKTASYIRKIRESEIPKTKVEIKQFLRKNSIEILWGVIKIKNLTENNSETEKMLLEITENNECHSLKNLNINGKDIQKENINPKKTGAVLDFILDGVINGKVQNKKEDLAEYFKKNIDKFLI